MTATAGPRRLRVLAPFERIVEALADPKRSGVTALTLIAGYVLLWWLYAVIAKSSQDIHFDMGEVAIWGLVPSFGYPKHPPFPGWVAAAWFSIFPRADWSFYLLSVVNIGIALWFVWLIASRFVTGNKRALALVLLAFSPGFNFQPLKFNSNALLIPTWAVASYAFIRSFQERNVLWGALAGVAAAIAMLTKYWSIFLIAGFVVAVAADKRCWDYLRSPAPWASVAAGALLLAPNVVTLFEYDFQPFKYATSAHAVTLEGLMHGLQNYFGGVLYLAAGLLVVALACRPSLASLPDVLLPQERDRRMIAVATATAFLAPVLLSLLLRTRLDTVWTMPMWAMLPAVVLGSQRIEATRSAAAGALAVAVAMPMIAVLLSPVVAYEIHKRGLPNNASHYRLVAGAIERAWRESTDRPLKFLGGSLNLALSGAFYLPSRPLVLDSGQPHLSPWADPASVARDGLAVVCTASDGLCLADMTRRLKANPAGRRTEVELSRTFFGLTGPAERYVIAILPP